MGGFKKFLDLLERIQRWLTVAFFFATLVVVAFQVINRMAFQIPVLWTVDISVFCFIWLALLSASCSVRSGGHFRVSAVIDLPVFSGIPRHLFELIALLAVALLSFVLLVLGMPFAIAGLHEQSPGLAMPMFWAYVSVPVCSATALLFVLEKIWLLLGGGRKGSGETATMQEAH